MEELHSKTITFISLNYAPEDTAIGLYSTQMVEALITAGAHVNVVTAMPYYPQWKIQEPYDKHSSYVKEDSKSVTVYRYKQYVPESPSFLKRVLHILSFTYGSWHNLKKIDCCDLVISIIPFTTSAYLGNRHAKKRKTPHWIHIQDFEFDAALQSGVSGSSKKWVFEQLFRIESKILKKASIISTISHLMIDKLASKTNTLTYYLPNWIEPAKFDIPYTDPHSFLTSEKFKLLYSGNVGDKQDWEFFLAFAKAIPQKDLDIIVVGAGSKMNWLKQNTDYENIHFHDPVPYDQLPQLLSSADAHILFQKYDVVDTVMPSKLLGMMASGKPSLVLGNPASEVRNVIEDSEGGKYLSNYSVNDAVEIIKQWESDQAICEHMGKQAKSYVITNFSRSKILDRWVDKLASLVE
ncbi:colanic acid biosynthesis glycosyl transferase WcaI [Nonlabens sp. Hel1_33_55]|uniref:WcaI family glycosyltransferase n=1 Tax=Nonlabens sp. Hel1_33_55 TaxID=1336802 RepID=UPI000875BDEE|nr:WcaI family glycosyltransferase [Nonlabens sp. Hel1_33_55]SCY32919.1 colanic acid biosynthesis glycosyl transferase WcaI [Nonlabens sp. Hel1_33_55]